MDKKSRKPLKINGIRLADFVLVVPTGIENVLQNTDNQLIKI